MARYECSVCGYIYDEDRDGTPWDELPATWSCPVCETPKDNFKLLEEEAEAEETTAQPPETASSPEIHGQPEPETSSGENIDQWLRDSDTLEIHMADIHSMASTGESISEPMRTGNKTCSWNNVLVKGCQIARIPLNEDQQVSTRTVIGPGSAVPLVIETPIYITHMSYGALSREAKIALARGSADVQTAMCSGEGGILEEAREAAHKYILEYVPHKYSVTDENLQRVDAVEIKIGQSAKPGMGGHLPGHKVTGEIASVRGFPEGADIVSPAHFEDIKSSRDLARKVDWLREKTGGKPIGVKLAAGNIEADLEIILDASPDFITIDGRAGATGSALKFVKDATSIPTIFALGRARRFLDEKGANNVSLVITGGLRISPDFAKALAIGADAIAIGTAALIACGCQQYRICNTGRCPMGITSQDPKLRARMDIEKSAEQVSNFLAVSTEEIRAFARLTGYDDVHKLSIADLCTTSSEISDHTEIEHV